MKTILLVEDERDLRLIIRTTLEDPRYRILEANDGHEALEILGQEEVDIVVLDWMLPGLSGIDVARNLRGQDRTRELPIVMVTARSQPRDREQGEALGISAYLVKPFSPLELLSVVEEALR
jgi:two-component system phosphate regulon response regulator PhoB